MARFSRCTNNPDPNIRLTVITGCSEMIKIENLSAEIRLDAAALEHIHGGGGKNSITVWGDPHETLRDRHASNADPSTLLADVGSWAKG